MVSSFTYQLIKTGFCFILFLHFAACGQKGSQQTSEPIDRYSLVTRHNPVLTVPDKLSPLSVGNGEFAFTTDITGLQTFPEFYSRVGETNSTPPGPDTHAPRFPKDGSWTVRWEGLHQIP